MLFDRQEGTRARAHTHTHMRAHTHTSNDQEVRLVGAGTWWRKNNI